ncbi:MAG: hypothetical protein WCI94_04510 [Rhodospirillales bacterium]
MNRIARWLPFSLLLLTAAGDAPVLVPAADTTTVYSVVRAASPGGPRKIVVRQTAGGTKTRIDSYIFADGKTPYESMILDSKSDRIKILIFARQAVVDAPAEGFALPAYTMTSAMRFKRGSDKTLVGQKCSEWEVAPTKGDSWIACVTAKGVILRSNSPTREIEASSVKSGPLSADTFGVPPDLKPMTLTPPPPK